MVRGPEALNTKGAAEVLGCGISVFKLVCIVKVWEPAVTNLVAEAVDWAMGKPNVNGAPGALEARVVVCPPKGFEGTSSPLDWEEGTELMGRLGPEGLLSIPVLATSPLMEVGGTAPAGPDGDGMEKLGLEENRGTRGVVVVAVVPLSREAAREAARLGWPSIRLSTPVPS